MYTVKVTRNIHQEHSEKYLSTDFPANIYLFKFNKRNTRKRCEICSKLTIKTPEQRLGCICEFLLRVVHKQI